VKTGASGIIIHAIPSNLLGSASNGIAGRLESAGDLVTIWPGNLIAFRSAAAMPCLRPGEVMRLRVKSSLPLLEEKGFSSRSGLGPSLA
jgi:hypothetical protein